MTDITTQDKKPTPTSQTGEQMMSQFSRELLHNDKAMAYIAERGIKPLMIEQERIGFCPPYSHHWFPLLKGRIVVPIKDVHGTIVALAGRQFEPMQEMTHRALWDAFSHDPKVAQDKIRKWDKGRWLNEIFPTKKQHLFQLYEAKPYVRERNYVNLVEGYMDAMVLPTKGMENTAALCGVVLSEHQAALLKRYCKHVVLILDPDAAGDKGVEKSRSVLADADLSLHIVRLPEGYDPDAFVLKYGGKQLRKGIENMIEEDRAELIIKVSQ